MTVVDPSLPPSSPNRASSAGDDDRGKSRSSAWRRFLLTFILLGLALRFVLAAICWGTNDANTFGQFGFYITRDGLIETYLHDTWLNHPPIPSYWCAAAWRLTMPLKTVYDTDIGDSVLDASHIRQDTPGRWFSAVFKLPSLLADCATAWLLYRLWASRAGQTRALAVSAMYAWSLVAILVCGYHCNTDPIYAFLCLLCVYLLQDRRASFLGGLALAAAINVKLTPVLLIPPLLLWHQCLKSAAKFILGLAVGALPFVPVFFFAGKAFYANAIAYKSNPDNWGITYLLMRFDHPPDGLYEFVATDHPLARVYFNFGRYGVLALIGAWAVFARLRGRKGAASSTLSHRNGLRSKEPAYDTYTLAAVTLSIFLFFTPGFGVQYTVMVLPLLFAIWPGMANAYGLAAGLFIGIIYWAHWPGHHWPPDSQFKGMCPWPSPLYGLVAWGLLGYFMLRAVFMRRDQLGYISFAGDKLSGK